MFNEPYLLMTFILVVSGPKKMQHYDLVDRNPDSLTRDGFSFTWAITSFGNIFSLGNTLSDFHQLTCKSLLTLVVQNYVKVSHVVFSNSVSMIQSKLNTANLEAP
jgi:hypothetical protein